MGLITKRRLDWRDKVCVVTGASSGIGRHTSTDLAAAGARVCAVARREERLASLVDEMGGAAKGHSYAVADVATKKDVKALGGHVRKTYGRLDVLINNAGFNIPKYFDSPGAVRDLEAVMKVNFYGAVYCTAELLPLLLESVPSYVVNVSSLAGRLVVRGASAYCASKFALVGWSETLHYELAPRGVFVSLVEPGPVLTEGFPQKDLLAHPVYRRVVADTADVSRAIRAAAEGRKVERMVPRWHYLLQFPRLAAPPLYRFAQDKIVRDRVAANTRSSKDDRDTTGT
jgi:short-subunit dehydrogenase